MTSLTNEQQQRRNALLAAREILYPASLGGRPPVNAKDVVELAHVILGANPGLLRIGDSTFRADGSAIIRGTVAAKTVTETFYLSEPPASVTEVEDGTGDVWVRFGDKWRLKRDLSGPGTHHNRSFDYIVQEYNPVGTVGWVDRTTPEPEATA